MRPDRVRKSSHLLTLMLLAAAAGFATVVGHDGGAERRQPAAGQAPRPGGDTLFAQRCARCHDLAEITGPLQMQMDPARARQELQLFLDRHRHASAAENEILAAWLVEQ